MQLPDLQLYPSYYSRPGVQTLSHLSKYRYYVWSQGRRVIDEENMGDEEENVEESEGKIPYFIPRRSAQTFMWSNIVDLIPNRPMENLPEPDIH